MNKKDKIDYLISIYPLFSEDLGIDLTKPPGRFKWFLASILFGARISSRTAANTYREFEAAGVNTAEKILSAGWEELVKLLDRGGYVRYDYSTASALLDIMQSLEEKYGSLEELYRRSSNEENLESKLQEFKGIGPITTEIFLRELRAIWNINPKPSDKAQEVAEHLGIDLDEFKGEKLSRVETALVKLYLNCCRKERCSECLMKEFCSKYSG